MKITCKVNGKPAAVVGYCPGRKNKIHAIVICEGKFKAVPLRKLELPEQKEEINSVLNLKRTSA